MFLPIFESLLVVYTYPTMMATIINNAMTATTINKICHQSTAIRQHTQYKSFTCTKQDIDVKVGDLTCYYDCFIL